MNDILPKSLIKEGLFGLLDVKGSPVTSSHPVFHNVNDHGIPTFLPPTPRTVTRRTSLDEMTPSTENDAFSLLASQYLAMLDSIPTAPNPPNFPDEEVSQDIPSILRAGELDHVISLTNPKSLTNCGCPPGDSSTPDLRGTERGRRIDEGNTAAVGFAAALPTYSPHMQQLSNSAPANLDFPMTPMVADTDFDVSPLNSPWLGAYTRQPSSPAISNKRSASSSDEYLLKVLF